ncbi:hypothetical protein GCM10025868_24580 [Angustibacter aerolatus]|uniref:Uncharacterized protein n=1 Tax=Angustibacter aerolatus TaxID=1162965 RepID=A0ABQ6JGA4_9ACTN|nr:hypothetical protein GCM10025868_24580 [Angustibacter aerolatus]
MPRSSAPLSLNAFTVPVTNLVGRPAVRGSGFSRLVWRDLRSDEQPAGDRHQRPADPRCGAPG